MKNPVLLVVDDDAQVLSAVRRDLRGRYRDGYTIMGAASGEQALDTARELKSRGDELAMIISDQRMPGMLGVEVLAKAREVFPLARRVLLTAYSDIDAAVRGINEAHLDHYLSKPWEPPEERLFPSSTNSSTTGARNTNRLKKASVSSDTSGRPGRTRSNRSWSGT